MSLTIKVRFLASQRVISVHSFFANDSVMYPFKKYCFRVIVSSRPFPGLSEPTMESPLTDCLYLKL